METEPTFLQTNPNAAVVGQPLSRVDGRAKVTGQAKYAAEYNTLPNLAHAVLKTSDIAHGRVERIDVSAARQQPGVLAIFTHENLPKLAKTPNTPDDKRETGAPMGYMPMTTDQIYYAAQPVAVVVADTLERAQYAATLVKVQYAVETPIASYQDPKAKLYIPESVQAGRAPGVAKRGNAESAFQSAPVQISATYTNATTHHNPMEPGATTAHWESTDRLTVYESTQGVSETQRTLSTMLGMPREQIRIITKYIGGGFGCKLWVWPHTVLTSLVAKAVGRPVKLVLTRPQQFTSMGLREEQQQDVKIGASQAGKLLSLIYEKRSTTSPWDEYAELNARIVGMLYDLPAYQSTYRLAHANVMTACATRAPGDAPGSYAIESAMDELAAKLGLDPLQIRLLNYADNDSSNGRPWSSKSLKECYARGAELIGWSKRNPKAGATREGKYLVGMGMASASYPVHPSQGNARVRLYADGNAVVQTGATDLGTGTYTIVTQVAADALGIAPEKVRCELGDTALPSTPWSGGSTAGGRVSSSVYLAAQDIWQKLIQMAVADAKSPLYRVLPADVTVTTGRMHLKADATKSETFSDLMKRASMGDIEGSAMGRYGSGYEAAQATTTGDEKPVQHSMNSFGAHFCEVHVDPELGTVRVKRWVSVIAGGRILNPKTARSQIMGGSIFGIGASLMEETVRDPNLARYTNASLADYHIPVNADIPELIVEFIDEKDPYINAMGAKGIGEIAIVGVSGAIANAVYHATGKRVRSLPITPNKVLESLREPV